MISNERKDQVATKLANTLGSDVVTEWCSNAGLCISTLLKQMLIRDENGNPKKPDDLEAMIAIDVIFTEMLKKYYHVDSEIMELEQDKAYRQFEQVVEQSIDAHQKSLVSDGVNEIQEKMRSINEQLSMLDADHPDDDPLPNYDGITNESYNDTFDNDHPDENDDIIDVPESVEVVSPPP